MSATYEIDVLEVAEKVLASQRGAIGVSVIQIKALAQYVVLSEQNVLENEKEIEDGNAE